MERFNSALLNQVLQDASSRQCLVLLDALVVIALQMPSNGTASGCLTLLV